MPDAPSAAIVRQLAPTGTLRAAINFGNPVLAQRDGTGGKPGGVTIELAHELGRRLALPVDLIGYVAAGHVFAAASTAAWDVAFLAIDPKRAAEIEFTAPYVIIEGAYMVPVASPLRSVADIDRPGVRIAVGTGSAYELYLTRTLKHAVLVHAPTGNDALVQFQRDRLEAAAGVRSPLVRFVRNHPELRVIDGQFMAIEQAMGIPKGRGDAGVAALAAQFLRAFVEAMKASGFVAAALARSGQHDAQVAPAVIA